MSALTFIVIGVLILLLGGQTSRAFLCLLAIGLLATSLVLKIVEFLAH